ncbi:transcriptional regulator ATRX homolog isoform X2 [Rhopilema esculentum]|uniref:transcriptional regulator ATRX homolog isoform X2 n=1 Tax=Rhopilema esculentum TaxID=499914 RepID=UPI0031D5F008
MSDEDTYSSRRSRRVHNDDDEEEDTGRSRRSRRAARDDDEEEESRSTRRSRRQQQDDEEEDTSSRRSRRRAPADDDEEEEAPRSTSRSAVSVTTSKKSVVMGGTVKGMNEARRKRVQQAIIDGMTKYAEQKFGRKKAAPKGGKTRSTMDDYDIYLRSLKTKIKTSQDRLNVVLKQKREIDEKVKKAEADVEKQEQNFRDAEDEKKVAEREGRDPKLPSGFIIPQTAKKAVAGAGFANLVMKASAQLWEDKFMAMRAKKGGSEDQPEWLAKSKRSDKILVNVGKKGHKKEEEQKPAWSTNLKKAEPRRKVEAKHDDGGKQPAFATVSLRKTTKKEEDEEAATKKVDWKEMEKKTSSAGGSRRRRGGDDSD